MDEPKTSEHVQINIRMQTPCQEHPSSSKAPNHDLKDMDVLCTLKIKMESQKLEHGCITYQRQYPIQDQEAKPQSQDPPASSKDANQNLKNMDVLCTLKIKMEPKIRV